jgi:hypothetical protein
VSATAKDAGVPAVVVLKESGTDTNPSMEPLFGSLVRG